MPSSCAADASVASVACSTAAGAVCPGAQTVVTATARRPPRRSRSSLAFAASTVASLTPSSAAPTAIAGPPAPVQHPPPRRQLVPVHRRDGRGRLPAGDVHAGAPPPRRRLLRSVREREEGARDARRPEPRLPVPPVRGAEARQALRDSVP